MHRFKTSALLAAIALSPAAAFAADLDVYEPAPRPFVRTQTRVLPPIVEREVVEQPIIREQVVQPRIVTRRVVRPEPVVVERRIFEQPVYVTRRPALVETFARPVYRQPRVVFVEPHRGWGGWRDRHDHWAGGYAGAHW